MILTYHKIDPEVKTEWWISPDSFYLQMLDLRSKKVVYLDDYNPLDSNQAVITFDGVYQNVWKYAVPILKHFNYPFELFVIGKYIGKDNHFDAIEPLTNFSDTDTLLKMVQSGGRLQWHSWSHGDLSGSQPQEFYQSELVVPAELRALCPDGFKWFAFPHGKSDEILRAQLQRHFVGALACDDGDPRDRYNLDRVTTFEKTRFANSTVSVIIPCYNYGHLAAEAIESVLNQTYPPDEILFIDDASSDNSVDVAKRYEPLIRVERNHKNLGVVGNFRKAVELTHGDYICFLGADNRFRADYVELTKALLDANPDVGVAYTHFVLFDKKAQVEALKSSAIPHPRFQEFYFREFPADPQVDIKKENYIHGSSMYRRKAYEEAGGYLETNLPEDHSLFARMLENGWKAKLVDAYVLEYRQHSRDQINLLKTFEIENVYLRSQYQSTLNQIAEKNALLAEKDQYIAEKEQSVQILKAKLEEKEQSEKSLSAQLAKREETLQALDAQVAEITSSTAWRVIQLLWRVRVTLVPHRSRRERFVQNVMQFLRRLRPGLPRLYFNLNDYDTWIAANEPSPAGLITQSSRAEGFGYKPLFSLIMPVWNIPTEILNQTISSVLQQTYRNWELCMVDASSVPDTRQVLSDWAKKDARFKIKFLDENKGIAVNSNEALRLANGELVGFLDHDDLLAPFALFEIVRRLQFNSPVDVIYSDEDKIDENGKRFDPFFKPDFSPDYLRTVNYMPHFLAIRKPLGDQIGWFREGYDGAQDYDLILRAVEKAKSVMHIPLVLYHWRAWTASTASGSGAKPYANASGKKTLQEHLDRIGLPAQVGNGFTPTLYREHYQLPGTPTISIIIPSHDHAADLETCINSILQKTNYSNFEIILVENGSKQPETFELYEKLAHDPRIHILKWDEPFNFSRLNNWAASQASGEVILFLNNDIQVINGDWLEEMLQYAIRPDVGAVGAKLYYPDDSIQHAGIIVGLGGVAGHSHKHYPGQHVGYFHRLVSVQNISAVTAACMMVRKEVFQEVNGFDEKFILAFGDVDLCLRIMQKGYLNVWTPYAELHHYESKTRGYENTPERRKRFRKEVEYFKQRWSDFLHKGDPYYNPNLTLDREDYSLDPRKNVHPSQLVREPVSPIFSTR